MNDENFDAARSDILRSAVIDHVNASVMRESMRVRTRRLAATFALGVAVVAGGGLAGASALGLLDWPVIVTDPLPGGDLVEIVPASGASGSIVVDLVGEGDERIPLPAAPTDATHVSAQLTCLEPGRFSWGTDPHNNPSIICGAEDVGTRSGASWYDFALSDADALHIGAGAGSRWRVAVAFVSIERTDWGVNDRGDSYGVENPLGTPDLIAVVATNGLEGYVYADDLAEANGSRAALDVDSPEEALAWQEERRGAEFRIPVYLSDGETVIGEFVVRG